WFDRLAFALKTTSAKQIRGPWGEEVDLSTEQRRLEALDRIAARVKGEPDERVGPAIESILSACGRTDPLLFKNVMLTWGDVHALVGLGFSVGAHTVNHPILSRVDIERARAEVVGSRDMIASALGRIPRAFAYPNGTARDYTPTVAGLVREAGFTCAVTTR